MAVLKPNSTIYSEANNDPEISQSMNRKINKKLDILDQKMDSLYSDIYISRPDNRKDLDNIIDKLDSSIDSLQSNDVSISGLSELLRRIEQKNNYTAKDLAASVEDLFNDQNLLNTLFMNEDVHRYIAGQNYQYDLICKYLPKLNDALQLMKDNVLSSDTFSKNFLNPVSVKTSKDEVQVFSANIKRIENEYDISTFLEDTYDKTSKYGEDFIYVVPYTLAFQRLLKRANYRRNNARLGQITFYENTDIPNSNRKYAFKDAVQCVCENFTESNEYKNYLKSVQASYPVETNADIKENAKFNVGAVNLHFNDTNIVLDKINEIAILTEKSELERFESLTSVFENSLAINNIKEAKGDKLNSVFGDLGKKNKLSSASNDGLIIPAELNRDPDKIDKDFNGAVLERLPRENVIPIYIGKKCMGYYYFDFKEDEGACGYCGGHHMTPGISNAQNFAYEQTYDQQELAIRYVASRISANIDTHFINANKDLKEEIYAILMYNDKFDLSRTNDIGVSFIPAEDIIHCYFKLDEHTHRGISDLQNSLVPAMLYILLYLTDIITKITRSTDKRIYYVKQNVETNVARTMMNVVQQIKKGNMGMRQIESMNNILNIIGKYNDFIIPVGQSGDAPISFEVMNGQNIETPTDLMQQMEEAAINPICPLELVNSSFQQDFATRFTMSNTRFLKKIFSRQRITQKFFSRIYTKVYNYEYNETYSFITIILPPPTYLTVTNTQQMLDSVNQLADKITDIEMVGAEDEVKTEFKKLYTRQMLSTYMDFDMVERLKEKAAINVEMNKEPVTADGSDSEINPEGGEAGSGDEFEY